MVEAEPAPRRVAYVPQRSLASPAGRRTLRRGGRGAGGAARGRRRFFPAKTECARGGELGEARSVVAEPSRGRADGLAEIDRRSDRKDRPSLAARSATRRDP